MSDDDDLESLIDDAESSEDSPDVPDEDEDRDDDDVDDENDAETEVETEIFASYESIEIEIPAEEETMSSDDDSATYGDDGDRITQAEVYENLKRIGELEDEKQKIQDELRERTEQLRSMLKHVDRNSILYKMLQSALADSAAKVAASKPAKKSASKAAPKAAAKKAPKKKARRK